MDALGGYVLRICCCGLIVGIIHAITGDSAGGKVRKMVTGLFMAFAVISPLREIQLGDLWELPEDLYAQGEQISRDAQENVSQEISDIIIRQTGAYILDEASALNVQLAVSGVTLDPQTLAPVAVELTGDVPPYARSLISDAIARDLGVEREAQTWKS